MAVEYYENPAQYEEDFSWKDHRGDNRNHWWACFNTAARSAAAQLLLSQGEESIDPVEFMVRMNHELKHAKCEPIPVIEASWRAYAETHKRVFVKAGE